MTGKARLNDDPMNGIKNAANDTKNKVILCNDLSTII